MLQRRIVSRDEWLVERRRHLEREKELTRFRDQISRERRALPWVRVEKEYLFEGPDGPESLGDLFDGRNQLIVYHFMFGPDWAEGCPSCSLLVDHIDGALVHLEHRDVTLRAVSRAPLASLEAYRKRMGWKFKWLSSLGTDFNFDYDVSFAQGKVTYNYATLEVPPEAVSSGQFPDEGHGVSVFFRDGDGSVYHTYSTYARGADILIGTYNWLDLVPKGRDEDGLVFPMSWIRRHDRYDDYTLDPNATYVISRKSGPLCCAHEG